MGIKFNEIKIYYLKVNQFTTWFFASITDEDGFATDVEFTNGDLSYQSGTLLLEIFNLSLSSINQKTLSFNFSWA